MYKRLFLIVALISILGLALATAFTVNPLQIDKQDRSVKMTLMKYIPGKGIVFRFQLYGRFTSAELKGKIQLTRGGDTRSLYCIPKDSSDKVVQCTAQAATAGVYGGEAAVVTFAGFTFPITIPNTPTP
jgi:hypothetical protein